MTLAHLLAMAEGRPEPLNRDLCAEIAADHMHECVQLAFFALGMEEELNEHRNNHFFAEVEFEQATTMLRALKKENAELRDRLAKLTPQLVAREALTP